MEELSAKELIGWLRTTTTKVVPYKNSQMVAVVRNAALLNDKNSLEELSNALVGAYIKFNKNKPREVMVRNALETLATLAYLADHNPSSPLDWMALGPVKAYQLQQHYGPAMSIVKSIYSEMQIDLIKDIYQESSSEEQIN